MQDAVRAHGEGAVVFEPRVHLVPDNGGAGHFNVLRGHLSGPGAVSGIKVVGDFHRNWQRGLPSEMGLLTLYDPETGTPRAVLDATLITACRTGAMTAVGARFLASPTPGCSATQGPAAPRSGTSRFSTVFSAWTRSG